MSYLEVAGGNRLEGNVVVSGAKNAALPVMAACLLMEGDVFLHRIPDISDVWIMTDILKSLGARVEFEGKGDMRVNCDGVDSVRAPYELVGRMNASFDIAGPLIARYGEAEVSLPGGCNLGSRPVNLHIDGFRALGAEVDSEHGYIRARTKGLKGAKISFPKSSVGATKNCMMAAVLAEGETVLENAAMEPEVSDLALFLNAAGARIDGVGTSTLVIRGVKKLGGIEYEIIPDRLLTGMYLIAAAATMGDVTVENTRPEFLDSLLTLLQSAGQHMEAGSDWVRLRGGRPVLPFEVISAPYPGFPTDLQPIVTALATVGSGTSVVVETIFDRRYMYVDELRRLGADISLSDRTCVVRGVPRLSAAPVKAHDIRAGGALIVAALAAEGESTIEGLEFIDRGHEKIEEVLSGIGARIRRVP